jgi:hypothetical protein
LAELAAEAEAVAAAELTNIVEPANVAESVNPSAEGSVSASGPANDRPDILGPFTAATAELVAPPAVELPTLIARPPAAGRIDPARGAPERPARIASFAGVDPVVGSSVVPIVVTAAPYASQSEARHDCRGSDKQLSWDSAGRQARADPVPAAAR